MTNEGIAEADWRFVQIFQNPVVFREFINDGDPNWHGLEEHERAWTAYGTQIIYVAERDGKSKIFIMNADGTNKKPLTTGEGSDYSPDFADASHTQATSYPINEPTTLILLGNLLRLPSLTGMGIGINHRRIAIMP